MPSWKCFCLFFALTIGSCVNHVIENPGGCDGNPTVRIDFVDPMSCATSDGSIFVEVNAAAGIEAIKVNGERVDQFPLTRLTAGVYEIEIIDRCQASYRSTVELENAVSDIHATADTTPDDGCINAKGAATINVAGGSPPYVVTFHDQILTANKISGLRHGVHNVFVTDVEQCVYVLAFTIGRGETGVSWSKDIEPIISTYCAKSGCHIEGTGRVNFTSFDNVKSYAFSIRTKVQNGSMPYDGPLDSDKVQLISCWVDDGAPAN